MGPVWPIWELLVVEIELAGPNNTVADAKVALQEKTGLDAQKQTLSFGGAALCRDELTLAKCGVHG